MGLYSIILFHKNSSLLPPALYIESQETKHINHSQLQFIVLFQETANAMENTKSTLEW